MSRGLTSAAACILVLALVLPVPTIMAHNERIQAGQMQTADVSEALARDAQEYAKSYGVDQQEAIRRLERQRLIGQLGAALETGEPGSYASLWIQHRPDYRAIALFTRDGAVTVQRYVAGGALSGVVESRSARLTLLQLQAAQATVTRSLNSLGIPANSRVNVPENRTEILVTDRARLDAAIGLGNLQLPDGVVIITVPGLMQTAVSAGESNVDCTLGFSVSGPEGLGTTTAGHCGDMQNASGAGLPFIYSWYYGPYDMQWHTSPFATVYSRAYDGVSSPVNYRAIVATSRSCQPECGGLCLQIRQDDRLWLRHDRQ
jgi:hypothetical protein